MEELLTIDDLSKLLRIDRKGAYARLEKGQLPPALRIGRSLRWRAEAVRDWLEAQEKEVKKCG